MKKKCIFQSIPIILNINIFLCITTSYHMIECKGNLEKKGECELVVSANWRQRDDVQITTSHLVKRVTKVD